jgi:hypothetical protein
VTDAKKGKGAEVRPRTAGAIGRTSAKKFLRTLEPEPVPAELLARASDLDAVEKKPTEPAAPAREKTIEVSASDADVMIETNPGAVPTQEPTDPGVLQRRRLLQKRIAFAVAGGLGLVAIAIAVRVVVHRKATARSAPAEVPAAPVPAVSSTPPATEAPAASEAPPATVRSATPLLDAQSPAASASARTSAPTPHPARPKHPPAKGAR